MAATGTLVGGLGNAAAAKAETAIHKTKLTIAMTGTYSTGGDAIVFTSAGFDIGLANIRFVTFGLGWQGYTPIFDEATGKIVLERTAAINLPRQEVPNATDVTAIVAGEMFIHHD